MYIVLEDVNDDIPLFTEREQETVLEGEPIGTGVTRVNAIDKDGTFPNNQVWLRYQNEFLNMLKRPSLMFNCISFRFITASSIPLVTKAKITSKSTSRRARSSPKLCSIVRNRLPTPSRWKPETEPLRLDPTATVYPTQVSSALAS